jgi:hypothetical protein
MMACGCASQGVRTATKGVAHDPIPSCLIHDCIEVATNPPDLSARLARCTYYGRRTSLNARHSRNECNYGQDKAAVCTCEQPSSPKLPFFESKPSEQFDKFYCGCMGWD